MVVIRAQGDEIPWVIVGVVSIKVMHLNNQVPSAHAALTLMVVEADGLVVITPLVIRVVEARPVKAIVAAR